MIKWLLNLFKKSQKVETECRCGCSCGCCNKEEDIELITLERRGFQIILAKSTYETLREQGYTLSITTYKEKPSCVQMKQRNKESGKTSYVATLKTWLGVKSFKDGNICNFDPKNLEYEKE